ncbi:collagen alpha-1(VI) chain-like [Salminus brasiliensis]|uniref:collagen alpha-1(VI) chain-like n=1 Tax=Salminus brasiliensis TaxID=930266 RepID=UPI003B82E81C
MDRISEPLAPMTLWSVHRLSFLEALLGAAGDPGPSGHRGEKGDPGPSGGRGGKGAGGRDGKDGLMGEPGMAGLTGCKGDDGDNGDFGRTGLPGTPGVRGERGLRGPPGLRGVQGEKGDAGPFGAEGHEGLAGDIGSVGLGGVSGLKGHKGEPGQSGLEGVKGSQGPQGSPGEPGAPGVRGEDGSKGLGEPGYSGFQGYPGLRGPPGVKGIRGLPGLKGESGLSGDPGNDNDQPGSVGLTGPKGYPGLPGETGFPGPHGLAEPNECEIVEILKKFCSCCEHECSPVKLLFILDSSESVGRYNFALEKEFIIHVINKITKFGNNKNEHGSRVGIVQYSHEGTQELVSMDDPKITTLSELKSAVKNMRWIAGGTYTGEALDFARKAFGNSQLSRKVAIVLTDGRSDTRDTKPLSSLCTVPNIRVVGIGIGDIFRRPPYFTMLQEITCMNTPTPGLYLKITDHSQLLEETFFNNVTSYVCQDKNHQHQTCQADFKAATDIVFMLDGSSGVGLNNFKKSRDFVANMASRLLSSKARSLLRVSVIQYGASQQHRVEVPFTNNVDDAVTRLNAVSFMDSSTDLPAALGFLSSVVQKEWRPSVSRRVVAFTDGRTVSTSRGNLPRAAEAVKAQGTVMFALTVGDTFDETGVCQLVSGKADSFDYNFVNSHIHQVAQYSDLTKWSVMQSLAKKLSSLI